MKKILTFCLLCLFSVQAMSMGFPHSVAAAKRVNAGNKNKAINTHKMNLQKAIEEVKPGSFVQRAVSIGQRVIFSKLNND